MTEIIANYKASKPLKMKKICGQNEERAEAINGEKRKEKKGLKSAVQLCHSKRRDGIL